MRQLLLDLSPPPAPTLQNFALGRNEEVLHALSCWLSAGSPERCLYLWGPPGSGKTHLLIASASVAGEQGERARYTTARELTGIDWPDGPAWVMVDEVETLDAPGQVALFTLLNRAARGELRLLLAGAIAPAGLPLREDVRTRIGATLVFQLHPLSDEEKVEALQAHARSRGFLIPQEATEYLLRHAQRDLRWLLSFLDALDRYSLQASRLVTLPLVREVLREIDQG